MKILAKQFTKLGFTYQQTKRIGDLAIYKKFKPEHSTQEHYEVIRIHKHNGYELAGVKIEAAETFPPSETWGINGFSYNNILQAEQRFNKMLTEGKRKRGRPAKKI